MSQTNLESCAGTSTAQHTTSDQRKSRNPGDNVSLPKNRSTSNLPGQSVRAADTSRIRFSFDAGSVMEYDPMARAPLMTEHEHGLGSSGLRRIRQQPLPARAPTLPSSLESSSGLTQPPRSASMTLPLPSTHGPPTTASAGPASPTLNFSEDLSRFPSESLHSFSFAHQTEELLHDRQNVLQKSIDFIRDRLGWAAKNPGIASAQAKVSGDVELQSIMELLARANLLGHGSGEASLAGAINGPLTGPADVDGLNIFEHSFAPRSESLSNSEAVATRGNTRLDQQEEASAEKGDHALFNGDSESADVETSGPPGKATAHIWTDPFSHTTLAADKSPVRSDSLSPRRASLKRTYTDTSPLSLQNKLIETLARPYAAGDSVNGSQSFSPTSILTSGHFPARGPTVQGTAVHGHRWVPTPQAIFTTEAQAPWTILAANDLACLVFGVTKAEVRKLGILEVVREDRRAWLEERLRAPGSDAQVRMKHSHSKTQRTSPSPVSTMGKGITAQLLSKPSSRQTSSRRAHTDDGSGSSFTKKRANKPGSNHLSTKSRGVLLCGDVVPIQKRNGATGSASLWVKEKQGGLIWVLEEISEDVVYLKLDDNDQVIQATGAIDPVWGDMQWRPSMSIRKLIPHLPGSGKVDDNVNWAKLEEPQQLTVHSSDGNNMPATVTRGDGLRSLRVSSFPHIAGMMVLSASNLEIMSSNSVFSAALFGQARPDGLHISTFIPDFDQMLHILTEEDNVQLVDGIVIPEHSFRRARALMALREGNSNAAAIFLRPTGLPARHQDGAEIKVDVQMRVVKSESFVPDEDVIEEASEDEDGTTTENSGIATTEVVYALWITYSRHLHSVSNNAGGISPLLSRCATPHRHSPGQTISSIPPEVLDSDDSSSSESKSTSLTRQIEEAASHPISAASNVRTTPDASSAATSQSVQSPQAKKTISDFVILEEMGQGAYGQVKLVRYRRNNTKKMVLKYVTKRRILVDTWTRDRRLGTVPLEIHVLDYLRRDGLKHRNIVEMSDFFEDDINYYIEMIPHGLPGMDLFDYIEMRSTMDEAECRNIFRQVVAAVHHLHTKALVVHRDIKDENVVLDGEGEIKLIDFGSAAYIKNGPFEVFVGTIGSPPPSKLKS